MSANSAIEWTHHTLNFWWGCTKVSPACAHCYAEKWAKFTSRKLFGHAVQWGQGKPRGYRGDAAHDEAVKLNRQAAKTSQRTLVFVNSMSDTFDAEVPLFWLKSLLATIRLCPALTFQILTKRPEHILARLAECLALIGTYSAHDFTANMIRDWLAGTPPPNVWLGTTVEDQQRAEGRIPQLLKVPAAVRFLSCEPLLGPVNLTDLQVKDGRPGEWHIDCLHADGLHIADDPDFKGATIHWVIAGGESGPHARLSHPDWFRSLRDQCASAGVPFFFKQWGEWTECNVGNCEADRHQFIEHDGTNSTDWTIDRHSSRTAHMVRLGTDKTGNHLDGRQHLEFPTTP